VRALVGCALLAWSGAAWAQEPPTFPSEIGVVKLDVSLTRDGVPVENLRAEDFEVLDSGVRQQVELVSAGEIQIETALLLDTSGSVAGQKLEDLKQAVQRFVYGLGPHDVASLTTVAGEVRLRAAPTPDRAPLTAAVDAVEARGSTALCDAVFLGLTQLTPTERRPVLVVFSDGADFLSWLTPEDVEAAVKRSEAVLYVVTSERWAVAAPGLRHSARTWLTQLAVTSGGDFFLARERHLTETFLEVLKTLKTRYLLRYEPTGVAPGGWHPITVRAKCSKCDLHARQGYLAAP
jgi:VWFA-related protein